MRNYKAIAHEYIGTEAKSYNYLMVMLPNILWVNNMKHLGVSTIWTRPDRQPTVYSANFASYYKLLIAIIMFELKSFVKNATIIVMDQVIVLDGSVNDPIIHTEDPCVLISAKDLYRMIYGKDAHVRNRISDFIKKIDKINMLSDYDKALNEEIESLKVDIYCKNELEDAAFRTGKYTEEAEKYISPVDAFVI